MNLGLNLALEVHTANAPGGGADLQAPYIIGEDGNLLVDEAGNLLVDEVEI